MNPTFPLNSQRKKDGKTYDQIALRKIKRALVKFNPRTKDRHKQKKLKDQERY